MADAIESANREVLEYLFEELLQLGVEEFCIAAGARNAPIIAALYHEHSRAVKRYHFFDERSAGFFAVGRSLATQKPVAVVTTSGTAVAELLPATIEAYYQGLPLVIVSADRPSSYRGSGAPQAIEQKQIFEPYVGIRRDVEFRDGSLQVERRDFKTSGSFPYHFNVCLEEKVVDSMAYSGEFEMESNDPKGEDLATAAAVAAWSQRLQASDGAKWLVMVGGLRPDVGAAVSEFLERFQVPILAEDTANLQLSATLAARLLQGGESALKTFAPTHVLRIGAVPSWRCWRDLEAQEGIHVFNLATGAFSGLARNVNVETQGLLEVTAWSQLAAPQVAREASFALESYHELLETLIVDYPQAEPSLLIQLAKRLPESSTLFLGNSLTIRYWNRLCVGLGAPRHTYANRGANGIDGLISTWLGLGAESPHSAMVLGDLSALYDLSAPWIAPQLACDVTRHLIIVNNGGGKIFGGLPWLKNVPQATQIAFENTHQMRFESWAAMWQLTYQRVTSIAELELPEKRGLQVTELLPEHAQTLQFWSEFERRMQER